jgi:hypothetical protein
MLGCQWLNRPSKSADAFVMGHEFEFLRTMLWVYGSLMGLFIAGGIGTTALFGYCLLRFVKAVERKWEREATHTAARVEAERLNRPFTSDERRYQPRP